MKYCQSLLANIDFISKFRMGDILVILKGYYTYYSDSWKNTMLLSPMDAVTIGVLI